MSYTYDYVVFVGRFQPFHDGHKQVMDAALALASKVIVVIGSAKQPRTPKNPWTVDERIQMIRANFMDNSYLDRIKFVQVEDHPNDQAWVATIQDAVNRIVLSDGWRDKTAVAMIGHNKDESSYYLRMFPQWVNIDHEMDEKVSATDLRGLLFEQKNIKYLKALVPPPVFSYLETFSQTKEFDILVQEYEFIKKYKKMWESAPYPVTLVTVDACVIQSGHVLVVTRGSHPGMGQLALPGGYVEQNERLLTSVIRELREETKLKVPEPVLIGSIKANKVYDNPARSLRGRVITHAYLFELHDSGTLPKVKGGDDAKYAKWMPLSEVYAHPEMFFEDHHSIIVDLTNKL